MTWKVGANVLAGLKMGALKPTPLSSMMGSESEVLKTHILSEGPSLQRVTPIAICWQLAVELW